ncbi:MAG TPA: pitrilysin family protein [Geobacteraceae bacterium]|nr:pitrilysin family protein [Geobacteraceae bacterium]
MVNISTLSNGIRVISQRIPHSCSVTLGLWVVGGSRHEQPEYCGVSHFIEHLLFKGTESRSSFEIAREIDSMGGFMNAFTGREFVCYYVKVLAEFLPKALDLMSDIFLNSRFPEDELENERKVILQEIRMIEDSPDDQLHELFYKSLWAGHPLGMPITGSVESVQGMSRDFLAEYKRTTYSAGDIIISVAGAVEHHELMELLGPHFDSIPPGSSRSLTSPPAYHKKCSKTNRELEQLLFSLGTKGLPQNHPGRYDLLILNTILGGSMSSRLFQEVREKAGLAYSIYSFLTSHSDTGALVITGGTTTDKFPEVMKIVIRELRRLKEEPLTEEILSNAREQLKGNILLSLESSDNIMSKLAKNEIYLGGYQSIEQVIAGLSAVTAETLLDLCNELFDDNHITLQLLGSMSEVSFDLSDISI